MWLSLLMARCNEDLNGVWEFHFIVSSSYVIAFNWSTFVVRILCLIAFVFDLALWRLKAILMHWTSIFFVCLCLYSLFNHSQFTVMPKLNSENWIQIYKYTFVFLDALRICCLLSGLYDFFFIVDDLIVCCLLVLCIPFKIS